MAALSRGTAIGSSKGNLALCNPVLGLQDGVEELLVEFGMILLLSASVGAGKGPITVTLLFLPPLIPPSLRRASEEKIHP